MAKETLETKLKKVRGKNFTKKISTILAVFGRPVHEEDTNEMYDDFKNDICVTSNAHKVNVRLNGRLVSNHYNTHQVRVTYNGKVVYKEENSVVSSYRPGTWEKEINDLYKEITRRYSDKEITGFVRALRVLDELGKDVIETYDRSKIKNLLKW